MILVVTEKPSVANMIGHVLGANRRNEGYLEGGKYVVSWCYGHLAEYVPPEHYDKKYKEWRFEDLPIIPDHWKLSVASDKRSQFQVLKQLLNRKDCDYVVNACDAGREGELIFRRVYFLAKSEKPVKRLWISSMEDDAVKKGFLELKDAEKYQGLADAASCRAKADWLVGMNATRAYSSRYVKTLRAGRVQTPTLAMLVQRANEIEQFQPKPYYQVRMDLDGFSAVSDKFTDKEEAGRIAGMCHGKDAMVTSVTKKEKKQNPPGLYDLTTLQREANRFYGFTAKQTLDLAQRLYEKKLLTYPRTDSRFVTEETGKTLEELLEIIYRRFHYDEAFGGKMPGADTGLVVDRSKVSDHYAILTTMQLKYIDMEDLSEEEYKILFLVAQRMLAATGKPYLYEEMKAEFSCSGLIFYAGGKKPVSLGWKNYESYWKKREHIAAGSGKAEEAACFPATISEGDVFAHVSTELLEKMTKPPKAYTEDSLLQAMETAGKQEFDENTERKGLGTPATRAGMIEKLVRSGYVRRKGKQLLPTDAGIQMIEVMPDILKSAGMTAEWENQLLLMEKNQVKKEEFLKGIIRLVAEIVGQCGEIPADELQRFRYMDSIGICPKCGSLVFEGKRNFYCSNRECRFVLWKENYYLTNMHKKIDARMAAEFLKSGKCYVKDLYSAKTGQQFEAEIFMDVSGETVRFQLAFPPHGKQGKGKRK